MTGRRSGRAGVEGAASGKPAARPTEAGIGTFRVRLTVALIAVAVAPVLVLGVVLAAARLASNDDELIVLLLLAIGGAALLGLVAAWLVIADLTGPLRRIAEAVERVAAGEETAPLRVTGDDELARLAESHNRVAASARRRNAELAALLEAISVYEPGRGVEHLADAAAADARRIFGLIDGQLRLVPPRSVPEEEAVPGDPCPIRAIVRAGTEPLGVLTGHLPATGRWDPADQNLLELFASEAGAAIRNAQLFARIESQNAQLRELDVAKDEFLRGVSHNLQTPLTSIRAYAEQLRASAKDEATARKLATIAEQTERLTRLVRQLLTVTRLEAGVLRPASEVLAIAPRLRRAWEGLGAPGVRFEVHDESCGWLAVADPDQLDQILWALLDNAVKYGCDGPARGVDAEGPAEAAGAGAPSSALPARIDAIVSIDRGQRRVRLTVADHGPGVTDLDRDRLFTRFARGIRESGDGTGLGLYVSRELARAMEGDLVLEPSRPGIGAAFTLWLPGEAPSEDEA